MRQEDPTLQAIVVLATLTIYGSCIAKVGSSRHADADIMCECTRRAGAREGSTNNYE